MTGLFRDLRIATRNLVRRPGLALGVILTIGLGIGATTTVYGVVDGVIIRPLPYDDPGALVAVGTILSTAKAIDRETGLQDLVPMSSLDYRELRERARSFERLGAMVPSRLLVSDEDAIEEYVDAARVSSEFFEILGVSPALGRTFLPEEFMFPELSGGMQNPLSAGVAMITHAYWRRRYGGDPSILGQPLEPAGAGDATARSIIVGILPRDFRPPEPFFGSDEAPEIYVPLPIPSLESGTRRIRITGLRVVGRLTPGASLEQARAEAARIAAELALATPSGISPDGGSRGIGVNDLHAETVGTTGRTLWIFLGAAGLLLLLAAMNAATLILARTLDRTQELGVRMALGAGRRRIVRLLVGEAGILAVVGGALGVLLSYAGIAAFLAYAPPSIPRLSTVAVDGRVLAVAALVSLGTGIVVGLLPALRVTERAPWERLQMGGRSVAEGASGIRTALVGGQLAVAVVLLSGAGLLFSSFMRIQNTDPGFEPDGLIAMSPASGEGRVMVAFGQIESTWQRWDQVLAELGAVPGVRSVAGASNLPFQPPSWSPRLLLPDDGPETVREGIAGYAVTPEYLETMGTELVEGRGIERRDGPDGERVALVNESFVRTQLEGRNPIDMLIRREVEGPRASGELVPVRVVGVVEDVVQSRAEEGPQPAIYLPYAQADFPQVVSWWAAVRTAMPPEAIVPELRRALAPTGLSPRNLATMPDRIAATHTTPRFQALLVGAFSLVAMILAAMGLYGALAQSVRRRQRELGVRIALGADRTRVLRMVLLDGMRVSFAGLVAGMIVTLALSRVLANLLYEVTPTDPSTLVMVAAVLTLVSVTACLAPARRATAVDPVTILKVE